ncbi:MAG: MoaD/ThiS family protein [Nanoarchaeota archaeon]
MQIDVFNERENSTKTIEFSGNTVSDLLDLLKINPETVIVVRNDEVITENELLSEKDALKFLSVISGG